MKPINPIFYALDLVLQFYSAVLLGSIIMGLLIQFEIVNFRSPVVMQINNALKALTDPVLRRVRRYIPPLGGLDLSPLAVFFAISVLRYTITYIGYL